MNMLIYDENSNLIIRKPNGLEYSFENTDRPNLGFEYDVLVYDDIEVKIEKWEEDKCFNDQVKINLNSDEIDAIEEYINQSEPPAGVSLNNQYATKLSDMAQNYIDDQVQAYGFRDLLEVTIAGREGSNHPLRSDARRVMEYSDVIWNVYVNVCNEIGETREDTLQDFEYYSNNFPSPQKSLIA